MEVSGQPHALAAVRPGKDAAVPLNRTMGGVPVPVWKLWRRNVSFAGAGNRTTISQSSSPYLSHYTD
jgi:hypothetical protein